MLMKLTVLGCWAPYPRAGGACPGYLLQAGGSNILLDCGNGVFSNLRKYLDFRLLEAVIVSHFHPDHYLDLYCLRHAVEGARRISPDLPPLRLYLPEAPAEPFQQLSRYPEAFNVQAVEKLAGLPGKGTEGYKLDLARIRAQAESGFGRPVIVAQEGLEVEI